MRDERSSNHEKSHHAEAKRLLSSAQIEKLGRELKHLREIRDVLKSLTPEQVGGAHLASLAKVVGELERQATDTIAMRITIFNAFCIMTVPIVGAAIVVSRLTMDSKAKFDLFAYLCPMAAAFLAGVGLYNRDQTNRFFKLSFVVLMIGFVCYLQSKGLFGDAIADSVGFIGLYGSLALFLMGVKVVEVPHTTQDVSKPKKKLVSEKSVGLWATLIVAWILIAIYWIWFLSHHNRNGVCLLLPIPRSWCTP